MIRAIRRMRDDEAGVTLVEMMVVVMVMGIILAFTMLSVSSFQRSASGGIRRLENLGEARILMQVITKDMRTAAKLDSASAPFFVNPGDPTMTLADDNEVTFYANLNVDDVTRCPVKIRLFVDTNDKLIESVTEPDDGSQFPTCTYGVKTPRNRLVGRFVANAPDQPIFTYFQEDASGALVALCSEVNPAEGCAVDQTPLTVSDALQVKAVEIELAIRKDTSLTVAHTTVVNRVRLPNVYYNPPPSPSP